MPLIHIVKQKRGMKNIMDTVWGHYHDTNLFPLRHSRLFGRKYTTVLEASP